MLKARLLPAALLPAFSFLTVNVYAQQCVAPSYASPAFSVSTTGTQPVDIVTADFDRDGFLDVAVAEEISATVTVLLGTGGGFTPAPTLSMNSAFALAAEDIDHDGNPDIVVAGQGSDEIFVFLGDGTGGFTGPTLVTVAASGPSAIHIGDFNNDGDPDLAVGYTAGPGVAVHLGAGDGTFNGGAFHTMGFTSEMVIGDVNNDGNLDVLATDFGANSLVTSLGKGDGTFNPPINSPTGLGPFGLTIDDFDRDGLLDVVTVDQGVASFSVMRGQGNGSFTQINSIPGAGALSYVASGEVNGDGIPDLIFPNTTDFQVSVFLGDGAGDFPAFNVFGAIDEAQNVAVGDFDNDGRQDFVVTLWAADAISLYTNDFGTPCLNPSFAQVGRIFSGGGSAPNVVVTGDFDNDLFNDFVTADQASSSVTFHPGTGNGDFGPPSVFATGNAPISMAVADFTSEGDLDLVTANQVTNDLSILVGSGTGSFAPPVPLALPGIPVEVAAEDLNFDGKIDLVVALDAADVVVALGDGTGSFSAFANYFVGTSPVSVTIGDFDNDGIPDLAVAETGGEIITLQGVGDGSFNPGVNNPVSGTPTSVRAEWFNGDGNLDVVVTVGSGAAGVVQVLNGDGALGLGPGSFTALSGGPVSPHGLTTADVDGNGTVDAVVANFDQSGVDVLLGNGSGGFSTTRSVPTGEGPRAVAVDDFERDGNLDLAATQPVDASVWILPGDGAGFFTPSFFPSTGTDTRGVASGDLDHDGILDLVVANAGSDSFSVYLGTGGGQFGSAVPFSMFGSLKPVWVTVADFDKDGTLDVVTTNEGTSDLSFFRGQGNGSFDPPFTSTGSGVLSITKAVDFDFDGLLDLAVLAGNNVELMQGLGGGIFTSKGLVPLGGTGAGLMVGDFDRDGDVDIAATQITDDVFILFRSTGPGFAFAADPQQNLSADPRDFDAADFNGDGFLDFVVPTSQLNRVQLLLSQAGPTWLVQPPIGVPGEPMTARAADINRDGAQDFVLVSRTGNLVSFFTGDGSGGFMVQIDRTVGLRDPRFMTVADFDGDSLPDFVVVPDTSASPTTDGVSVVLNTNCKPMRLVISSDPSTCDTEGFPFLVQPELFIADDGDNLIQCDLDPVTAAIVPGTGTGGAALSGSNPVAPLGGTATFTDLSIDLPGGGYQLVYTHPFARLALSRTFSQGLTVAIAGPLAVCEGDPAVYDGGLGFDMYDWLLDTTPESMASSVDLTTTLTAGSHTLDLNAERDSCPAFDSISVDVTANLSSLTISPPGPESVCATCTGNTIVSTLVGGGLATYQWGYRTVSLGTITSITGETGPDYTIQGTDFPGVGTYFLVVTATPTCGGVAVSNEVQVDVTAASGPMPLITLTARSENTQNFLEWATPTAGPCDEIRILRRDDGTFPTNPFDTSPPNRLIGDFPCSVGGKGQVPDPDVLTNGTKYNYAGFVKQMPSTYSARVEVTGRPFDHTVGNVLWSYTTGASSLAPPGLRILGGAGTIFIVSNDNLVHSVDASGFWPANWLPFVLGGPAQSRPPVTSFPVGTGAAQANFGAVFVGSQDGDVYVIDSDEGDIVWQQNVGAMVQAAPAGIFTAFGATRNLLLVGTRNAVPNFFRAFDVDNGTPVWTFQNSGAQGGDNSDIGIISGGASVDYPNQRVFFGSRKALPAGNFSLWSVNFSSGSPLLEWAKFYGDIETSPIYLRAAPPRLVVANTAGDVYMIDATTGAQVWLGPFNVGDGAVKGFVFPQFGTPNYLVSTLNNVTSIQDNGPGTNASQNWSVPIPKASFPLFVPGTTTALVGGDNGVLYEINGVNTASPTTTSVTLGDGLSVVGAPTFHGGGTNIIYVGTSEGVIYAVQYPLP